ncbi:MAG TPA: LytTR family DNA-binding domain-containing protein [Vicinamibacterales bacterium]|nr:LytTR family DNA-binding domain-containing protein [Vicinamibacterales bacterium]
MSDRHLRLLVADDERLARALVRRYAAGVPDVSVAAECGDTQALEDLLAARTFDAALLDIRMPGPDIFEVLARVAERRPLPPLIFATAHDRYAVRAFEVNAIDYLVKPYSERRFAQAIARLRERQAPAPRVDRLLQDLGPRPDRLLVPEGTRMVPVAITDIAWIRAEGDYARLHCPGRSYLVSRTLNELEARLDPAMFLRVHRSAIVRLDQIGEVRPEGSSRYRLTLKDGTTLIVSRTRADALRRLIL